MNHFFAEPTLLFLKGRMRVLVERALITYTRPSNKERLVLAYSDRTYQCSWAAASTPMCYRLGELACVGEGNRCTCLARCFWYDWGIILAVLLIRSRRLRIVMWLLVVLGSSEIPSQYYLRVEM